MPADLIAWAASAATMAAAVTTALNAGSRVTGIGFVIFTLGSLAWTAHGILTGQSSLVVTNGVLAAINLFGAWRWLGRKARYEKSAEIAVRRSEAAADLASLVASSSLAGLPALSAEGIEAGTVVEIMLKADSAEAAYAVIASPRPDSPGEDLRAVPAKDWQCSAQAIHLRFDLHTLLSLRVLDDRSWPVAGREVD